MFIFVNKNRNRIKLLRKEPGGLVIYAMMLDYGRLRLSSCEQGAIRPLAVGRKNYFFCGSDASAVRASMIYSFIATCKAAGIEPREWFEDVIRRIPEYEKR